MEGGNLRWKPGLRLGRGRDATESIVVIQRSTNGASHVGGNLLREQCGVVQVNGHDASRRRLVGNCRASGRDGRDKLLAAAEGRA